MNNSELTNLRNQIDDEKLDSALEIAANLVNYTIKVLKGEENEH